MEGLAPEEVPVEDEAGNRSGRRRVGGWEGVCQGSVKRESGECSRWKEVSEAVVEGRRRRTLERMEGCWGSGGGCPAVEVESCWEGCRWEMGDGVGNEERETECG